MSTLSALLPASGTSNFVASGILPNGIPVALKADGTIEAVNTTLPASIPSASSVTYSTNGQTNINKIAFDPNVANQFVIAYKDYGTTGGAGLAVVGTITGTTLTFGTPVVFNAKAGYIRIVFDPSTTGRFVLIYRDDNSPNYATSIVGSLTGTTITFGTPVVFNSNSSYHNSISFDPNTAGKFVVAYEDRNNSSYATAVVGTVSGTTITYGTPVVFNANEARYLNVAFDPSTANKILVAYADDFPNGYGKSIVGTVSGNSITFGTAVTFHATGVTRDIFLSVDPNAAGKFAIAYEAVSSTQGRAVVGLITGTAISFGDSVEYRSQMNDHVITYNPNVANEFIIFTRGTAGAAIIVGKVSGTAITFSEESPLAGTMSEIDIAMNPNAAGQFISTYLSSTDSNYGTAVVGRVEVLGGDPTNLTETNFIGTSTSTYADGETASVTLQGGITTNQTGLTAGSTYYVQPDGTLATSAGTPSVVAGKALSETSLFLSDTPVASGGGGAWEIIQSQTVTTAVASLDFTGLSGYSSYRLIMTNLKALEHTSYFRVNLRQGGAAQTAAWEAGREYFTDTATARTFTGATQMRTGLLVDSNDPYPASATFSIDQADVVCTKTARIESMSSHGNDAGYEHTIGIFNAGQSTNYRRVVDGFNISSDWAGNQIIQGTFTLYGIKTS